MTEKLSAEDMAKLWIRVDDELQGNSAIPTALAKDIRALMQGADDAHAEARHWKAGAIYLADIHAANGWEGAKKSTSKSARSRILTIMRASLGILRGRCPTMTSSSERHLSTVQMRLESEIAIVEEMEESLAAASAVPTAPAGR